MASATGARGVFFGVCRAGVALAFGVRAGAASVASAAARAAASAAAACAPARAAAVEGARTGEVRPAARTCASRPPRLAAPVVPGAAATGLFESGTVSRINEVIYKSNEIVQSLSQGTTWLNY